MNTVVIGGGAAGMLAAYLRKIAGENVILLEKNEKLGKKMYITGKGRCNVTNDCDESEFLQNVVSNSPFMRSAVYAFPPEKLMQFLTAGGLNIKTERGNRVFPLSDKSSDVIKCFKTYLDTSGVQIEYNTTALKINAENGAVKSVLTDKGEIFCDEVIVCTGGKSYPTTGSTGDGYKFAEELGHTVIKPRAALVGLELSGGDFASLSGLTLKNAGITVFKNGKKFHDDFGEFLFTHHGASGPTVLSASSFIGAGGDGNYEISVDLKPALDEKTLDARVLRDFTEFKGKALKNSLDKLLPKSLIKFVITYAGLSGDKKNGEITAAERKKLVCTLKNLRFKVVKTRPLEEAIVTGGGVCVKEINPKTMESKLVKGLYFAGEVLDVDALTGGFNLQCAFSTAYLAGRGDL